MEKSFIQRRKEQTLEFYKTLCLYLIIIIFCKNIAEDFIIFKEFPIEEYFLILLSINLLLKTFLRKDRMFSTLKICVKVRNKFFSNN